MSNWVFANSFLIIMSVLKIMSLTRMFYSFAFLNRLIKKVLIDIVPFFINYLVWLVTFTLLFIVAGIRPFPKDDDEYKGLPDFIA